MPEKNSQNRSLGYARVSTVGQTLGAQLDPTTLTRLQPDLPEDGDGRAASTWADR